MPSEAPSDPCSVAGEVAERVLAAPPTLGTSRLVCVDGPAGSGKTTLAAAIADVVPEAHVVHCDELLAGVARAAGARPHGRGVPRAALPRRGEPVDAVGLGGATTGPRAIPSRPEGCSVLEGTGCWSPAIADLVGVLVWVEAESELRLRRGMARDGEHMRPQWEQWRVDEDVLFARLGTRARADLVVVTD